MKLLSLALLASLSTAALAESSADACTLPASASVRRYYNATYSQTGDRRCTSQGAGGCHLSGWLYTPTGTSGSNLPAIVYVHGSGANWSEGKAKDQQGGCEMIAYFVSRGYVVWNPYMRGVADKTNNATPTPSNSTTAGFINTGLYVEDYMNAESSPSSPNRPWYTIALQGYGISSPTTTDYKALTTLDYMDEEVSDVSLALSYLASVPGLSGSGKLVDANKIALTGHSYGAATVLLASAQQLTPKPRVVVNLSAAVLSWNGSIVWEKVLTDAATDHQQPLMTSVQIQESSTGTFEPGVDVFNAADATGIAALDKYGPFTLTQAELDACAAKGQGVCQCYHVHFQDDADQVARWAPDMLTFLTNRGVTP